MLQYEDVFQPNFRILLMIVTAATLCLISAESVEKDKVFFRKLIFYLLIVILLSEIIGHIVYVYEPEPKWIQAFINKIGVQIIFIVQNCWLCYAMSFSLKHNTNIDFFTTSKVISCGSIVIVLSCIIMWDRKFGRPAFAANALVSFYTLYLLKQIKKQLNNQVPITIVALNRIEFILLLLNIYTYYISWWNGSITKDTWYIFNQLRLAIYILYLFKIYVVIIGWRAPVHANNNHTNNDTHNNNNDADKNQIAVIIKHGNSPPDLNNNTNKPLSNESISIKGE